MFIQSKEVDYLIIGRSGYLGNHIYLELIKQNKKVKYIGHRLHDINGIKNQLLLYKPRYVINAAGSTGSPNIDWCDDNKELTIETNVTYQLTLCHICRELNIHLTIFGSGGIFNSQGIKTETDQGDYFESFYSECRIYLENLIKNYENILYLRVNYPISSDDNEKNLLIKLSKYNKIANTNMSITCLDTLLPLLGNIIENNETGIFNFINPGIINLIDIKKLFNKKNNIENNFETIENKDRPCPILDSKRIEKYNAKNIKESIQFILQL